jgi:uncharacterized protein YjbI with pentapeptide repeats
MVNLMNINNFFERYTAGERDFQAVNLAGSKFENKIFENIDLRQAKLENSEIRNCKFINSNLTEASFAGTNFDDSQFVNTNLHSVSFASVEAIFLEFKRCNLNDSLLINSLLGDVYFIESSMHRTQWKGSSWSGEMTESDLKNAILDGLKVGRVALMKTILPNGTLSDQIWENLIFKAGFCPLDKSTMREQPKQIELYTDLGVDYTTLHDLLSEKKWTQADRETAYLICKVIGISFPDMIETSQVFQFPCKDLQTIDSLWTHFSWDHFGLSVQNQIWRSISLKYKYDEQNYKQFCNLTGWSEEVKFNQVIPPIKDFYNIDQFTDERSIKQVPRGFLPAFDMWPALYGVFFWGEDSTHLFSSIYSRIYMCQTTILS